MKQKSRPEAIQEFLTRYTDGKINESAGVLLDDFLKAMERQNPGIFAEPTLEIMEGELIGHVMLREYMLANNIQAAMADAIRDDAKKMYQNNRQFHDIVNGVVRGIMRTVRDYIFPVTSGDLMVNINIRNKDAAMLEHDLAELFGAYNFKFNGKHIDDRFTRIAFKFSPGISADISLDNDKS